MPSGKTHDTLTFLFVAPTLAGTFILTNSWLLTLLVTCGMIFGGLMFGPDLDVHSKQYTRWGVFRFLWLPYQIVFRHRSRWSHGILFGTLIRVVYFTGIIALILFAAIYLRAMIVARTLTPEFAYTHTWLFIASFIKSHDIGSSIMWATLAGIWWGAALHTLADFTWTVLRKGKEIF